MLGLDAPRPQTDGGHVDGRLGVAPHVVERILNHEGGTFGGVAGVYNRFGYLPEMRMALELWAEHVLRGEGKQAAR